MKITNSEQRRLIKWINYFLLMILFASNFAGSPSVRFVYLGYSFFVLVSVLLFDFKTIFPILISFAFVEGQGRILWGYHPAARIVFDGLIVLATLRHFIQSRDLRVRGLLPLPMLIFIFFHFLWYAVEIFNLNSLSYFASIAGSKVYIFPFFLLIFLRKNKDAFTEEFLLELGNLICFLLITECALGLYQLQHKENFMLAISANYRRAMSGDIFTLDAFRPFGTTQLPGAISVFIYLSFSFIFLRKKFSKKILVLFPFLISLFFITLIVCQVRSATLKFAVIFFTTWFAVFYNSPQKISLIFRLLLGSIVFAPFLLYLVLPLVQNFTTAYVDIQAGLDRWVGIENVEDVTSQRTGFLPALEVATEKLRTFPMGVGPATTGAAGGLSADMMKNDPVFTKDTFWGYDNFYLSMIIEYGYGCVFYLGYIFLVPYYLLTYFFRLFKRKDFDRSRIVAICSVNIIVILIGNWGAIGLPYNPESFFFWLWTAVAFNTYDRSSETSGDRA